MYLYKIHCIEIDVVFTISISHIADKSFSAFHHCREIRFLFSLSHNSIFLKKITNRSRASYVSVLTVVAFSTERYLAICHPLYKLAISSLQRALRIITCLWILSFLFAFPFAINSSVHYITYPLNSSNILPVSRNSFFIC